MSMRCASILTVVLLAGCGSAGTDSSSAAVSTADEAELVSYGDNASALAEASFGLPLSKAALRAASPDLDGPTFETKWKASLAESPVMFARAWPGAYHADLGAVSAKRLMGREALCLGDAHPDNFGYLLLDGETVYSYNDLDDSGYCPAVLDALRYFTIIRLYFGDDVLTEALVESYVDGLKDAGARSKIAKSLSPDWGAVASKELTKVSSKGRLIAGSKDGLKAASKAEVSAVKKAIVGLPALEGAAVIDVGVLERSSGGSGGLARYWALVDDDQALWELKQAATPGTELGRHVKTLPRSTRLSSLKKAFWSTTTDRDYVPVSLFGSSFLLRNRLAKKSVDLASLSKKERAGVLGAQVGLMAAFHEAAMKGVKKDDLRPWLLASSSVVSARWRALYQVSGGK